jgi:hypothetical protein
MTIGREARPRIELPFDGDEEAVQVDVDDLGTSFRSTPFRSLVHRFLRVGRPGRRLLRERLGVDPHVVLQRRDEVGHQLHRNRHARPDRRAEHLVGLGLPEVLLGRGRTSQKVSVKSNGVCDTAQKLV